MFQQEGDLDMAPESPPSSDEDELCAKEQRQQVHKLVTPPQLLSYYTL